jgi:hypothetical protein
VNYGSVKRVGSDPGQANLSGVTSVEYRDDRHTLALRQSDGVVEQSRAGRRPRLAVGGAAEELRGARRLVVEQCRRNTLNPDELIRQFLAHPVRQPLRDPRRGRRRLASLGAGGVTITNTTYI